MRKLDLHGVPTKGFKTKKYDWKNSVGVLVPYSCDGNVGLFKIMNYTYDLITRRNTLHILDTTTGKNYELDSRYFKDFKFNL